ncbi:MAG: hypothetical protein FWB98_00945 [Defluviitaleaceae bacterium]|nr:hypothetical protein [Defluviitaleaceae bacterium]
MKKFKFLVVLLLAAAALTACVYDTQEHAFQPQETHILNIVIDGHTYDVTIDLLQNLGAADFTARGDNFTGLPFANLLSHFNIDYHAVTEGLVIGEDGFSRTFSPAEMLDYTNFFIAFARDGELLPTEGRTSHFGSIFTADGGPGRFVRQLTRIELNTPTETTDIDTIIAGLDTYEFAIVQGTTVHIITMDDLLAFDTVDFTVNELFQERLDRDFTGIPMSVVFESLNLNLAGAVNLTFRAADGFIGTLSVDEAQNLGYFVIAENGQPLGTYADGGIGPFFSVARDLPNNRWVRYMQIVTIN